jgi:general secretion pathway protein K
MAVPAARLSTPRRQRGVALILAMLVMALVTAAVTAMAARQQLDIRRTANLLNQDQAYLYALAVETWGELLLQRDREHNRIDDLKEDWARLPPPIHVEGGSLSGRIEDLQGRFNLNDLIVNGTPSAPNVARFRRLLEQLGLDPQRVQAVLDWLDPDQQPRFPSGAEDGYYLGLSPPYRAANRPMVSPTELLLVAGFTPKIYDRLAPFVTALPTHTLVNVNTAPAPVLAMLVPGLSLDDAKALVQARDVQPYQGPEDFLKQSAVQIWLQRDPALAPALRQAIGVASSYFLIRSAVRIGRARVFLDSVVHRDPNGETVIMRTRGTL